MASKQRRQESERRQLVIVSASQLMVGTDERVVRETEQRPVRSQPMRGLSVQSGTQGHVERKDSTDLSFKATSIAEQQAKTKERFCTQLLVDGYVQSFVEFFQLMHRNEHKEGESVLETEQDKMATPEISTVVDLTDMTFLRDQLVVAELGKRQEKTVDVMAAYDTLATYFARRQDGKTMIYFLEKGLEVARHANDQVNERRILRQIGMGYYARGDLNQARQYLELIVKVANEHDDDAEVRKETYTQLGKVYDALALQREQAEQYLAAIDLHKLRLDCAIKSHNFEAQMHSQYKIGTCFNALNDPASGLPFLEPNLSAARQSGDLEGEGNACAALATAHEKLGNHQLSIEYLNHYLLTATRAENVVNQADACARLGQIYTTAQDFQRAREMHEKNYELIQSLASRTGDRLAHNNARVSVGAARANDKLAKLLFLVQNDFQRLLTWKTTWTTE